MAPSLYHPLWLLQVHPCAQLGSEQQLVLPGFGVEAVLKNMEYSAVDDKAKAAAKQAKGGGDEPLGTAKGFDFDQLVKRKPHLKQELLTFKDALTATDDGEALKVRQPVASHAVV
jgi:UDP-glucose:glycoprotein glucosyltransferase